MSARYKECGKKAIFCMARNSQISPHALAADLEMNL
jgi:hypothetical protein